jgi:hypothetical protein
MREPDRLLRSLCAAARPVPDIPAARGPLKASDAACALPLEPFRPAPEADFRLYLGLSHQSRNRRALGRASLERRAGGSRRLAEFTEIQAGMEPPPILAIAPDRDSPCAVVQRTLSVALQIGRCSPQRCALEWPGAMAPPLLPDVSKLLGNWVLVSIDDSRRPGKRTRSR